jgi:hypothetical protein
VRSAGRCVASGSTSAIPACSGVRDRDLVEWGRVARRVGWLLVGWAALALLAVAVSAVVAPDRLRIPLWAGVAGVGFLVSTIGMVAVSALRGMLRAGERGERLAGRDVGLAPPQLRPPRDRSEDR